MTDKERKIEQSVKEAHKTYSNTEIARIMRKLFKELGYKLSVRKKHTAIYVTVKDLETAYSYHEIESIAHRFKSISYDERTGEILSGGNLYVFVDLDSSIYDNIKEIFKDEIKMIEDKGKESTARHSVLVFETKNGIKVWYNSVSKYFSYQEKESYTGTIISVNNAALIFMYLLIDNPILKVSDIKSAKF